MEKQLESKGRFSCPPDFLKDADLIGHLIDLVVVGETSSDNELVLEDVDF